MDMHETAFYPHPCTDKNSNSSKMSSDIEICSPFLDVPSKEGGLLFPQKNSVGSKNNQNNKPGAQRKWSNRSKPKMMSMGKNEDITKDVSKSSSVNQQVCNYKFKKYHFGFF